MLISLTLMERYQKRLRQLPLDLRRDINNDEIATRIAYAAQDDAWGALAWHMLHTNGRSSGDARSGVTTGEDGGCS